MEDDTLDWYRSTGTCWPTAPLRSSCELVNGFPFPSASFKDSGVIPLVRVRDIRGSTFKTYLDHHPDPRFVIENGNLVIGMDGDFNCIRWIRGAAALNQRICLLKSTDTTRLRFIAYALPRALKHLNDLMPAATVKHLSSSEILKTHIPVPGVEEIGLIVRYLDHAELRIAKAIAAKQDVVRLLKEQKAVVESRALFGGGWTTGVEKWFGEVPAGWEVLPSRALFAERIERNHGDLEMLSVTMARGVVRQSSYLKSDGSKKDQAREDRSQYKAVEPDDLVYNKMRAWQGAAGKSEFRGIVSPAYVVLRPLSGANSDYYGMMLRSRQFAREAERHSYGITSDMWSLRPQHFKLIEFPSPPLAEQAAIVNLCKAQTEKIDLAIEAIEAEITLLKEYRTRLISDVVTGKLDVRDEAAKLSDIDPMELATAAVDENGDEEEATDDD